MSKNYCLTCNKSTPPKMNDSVLSLHVVLGEGKGTNTDVVNTMCQTLCNGYLSWEPLWDDSLLQGEGEAQDWRPRGGEKDGIAMPVVCLTLEQGFHSQRSWRWAREFFVGEAAPLAPAARYQQNAPACDNQACLHCQTSRAGQHRPPVEHDCSAGFVFPVTARSEGNLRLPIKKTRSYRLLMFTVFLIIIK